jgi:serine/threonine protein kinase
VILLFSFVPDREYSFDLRALVNCLLAKEYQQRPSVNTTLILPFLRPYIKTHLQSLRSTNKKQSSSSTSTSSPPPPEIPDLDDLNNAETSSPPSSSSSAKHVYHCGKCGKPFNTGER